VILRERLLDWYEPRRRRYPWRAGPGRSNPYRVLVSEVMLQQTQVSRVEPAYRRFLRRFPSVRSLAAAPRSEVLKAWAGLGYNRRAVALSDAARAIVQDNGGRVPADPEELQRLPGVGPYTAAAVASLGHGVPVPAVDTNVERVVSRAILGTEPTELRPADIFVAACRSLDRSDPGSWNQAVMDLGREVCRPVPRCETCPVAEGCRFLRAGRPRRLAQRTQPPFEGSMRQIRGGIVGVLRVRPSASLRQLADGLSQPLERVAEAIVSLDREGLVTAGPAALAGNPRGRVRLPG
jgi:A/G-specific adenine glycosylase